MAEKIHRNSLKPGYKLHWYEVDEVLGQGGFGITYLASDINLHTKVAIKEYLPIEMAVREGDHSVHPVTENHDKQFKWGLDRFLKEARTLAQFNHPNIVRVLAVFEENNTGYMVMSYEEGISLAEKLRNRKTMEEQELVNILIPLMGGLEKMHTNGFIHRDIKPDNIFIRNDGSPVLLDFGSARQAMGGETRTLTSLVTPGYAPFEQYYAKSDEQGPWTDIYGLGATLYRAVTGIAPADAVDRSNALLKRVNDTYIPCGEFVGDSFSERFLTAIDSALKFNIEDRPQSMSEWRAMFGLPEAPLPGAVTDQIPTQPGTFLNIRSRKTKTRRPATAPAYKPEPAKGNKAVMLLLVLFLIVGGGFYFKPQIVQHVDGWQTGQDVEELLAQGRKHLDKERYTTPPGSNAFETFRQVLMLQPDNAEAQLGMQSITNRLINVAREAIQAKQFDEAKEILDKANTIRPDAAGIRLAKTELDQSRLAHERHLTEETVRINQLQSAVAEALAVADDGKITETLGMIEKARTLQADEETISEIKQRLYLSLESQAGLAAQAAKLAVSNNDTNAARQALARAKNLKSKLASLNLPQPELNDTDQIYNTLNTARLAADKGLLDVSLENLEKARSLGADGEDINVIRQQLRSDLEAQATTFANQAKKAMQEKDTRGARLALQQARDIKAKLDKLNK